MDPYQSSAVLHIAPPNLHHTSAFTRIFSTPTYNILGKVKIQVLYSNKQTKQTKYQKTFSLNL